MKGEDVLPVFRIKCFVYDAVHSRFFALEEAIIFTDETPYVAKRVFGSLLGCSPSTLALFFTEDRNGLGAVPLLPGGLQQQGNFLNVLETVKHLEASSVTTADQSNERFSLSGADVSIFDCKHMMCMLPGFRRTLLVVRLPPSAAQRHSAVECDCEKTIRMYWPLWSPGARNNLSKGPFPLTQPIVKMRSLQREMLSLGPSCKALGDIGERLELVRMVVEFSSDLFPRIIPEYVFAQTILCTNVPFAMCRSPLSDVPCSVRVWKDSPSLGRTWPFRSMRCKMELRPKGILFRVMMTTDKAVSLEWYPGGAFRVTVGQEHYPLTVGAVASNWVEEIRQIAHEALVVFLQSVKLPIKLPKLSEILTSLSTRVVDVDLNYMVFAAIPNIRLLVDDGIREAFFMETDAGDNDVRSGDDVTDRRVSLFYAPLATRTTSELIDTKRSPLCKIIRSTTNGVLCRIRLQASALYRDVCPTVVLHAATAIRMSVAKALPREVEKPLSVYGLRHVDPELYNSMKNLSRIEWTTWEDATQCFRPRRATPINPMSTKDMEKYNSTKESGPIMIYRNSGFAAIDDELTNGDAILKLRKDYKKNGGRLKKKKGGKKKKSTTTAKKHPNNLLFYNCVVLKEVTKTEHRTEGYEDEAFRYVPGCIRMNWDNPDEKLPPRYVAIMAPLFRRGKVQYIGRHADRVKQQLGTLIPISTYVTTSNKTLPPGAKGKIPTGAITEWLDKINTKQPHKFLRIGVFRDKDCHWSALHSLIDIVPHRFAQFDASKFSSREVYIRKIWKAFLLPDLAPRLVTIARDLTPTSDPDAWSYDAFNQAMCELVSVGCDVNVVMFHFSYVSPNQVSVEFAGKRFDASNPTIMLIQSLNGNYFEPISMDGCFLIQPDTVIMTEIVKLFQRFYPNEYQQINRLEALAELHDELPVQWVNKAGKQFAVQLADGTVVPMIYAQQSMDYPVVDRDRLVYNSSTITEILTTLSEMDLEPFIPHALLEGPSDMVYGILLRDTRLICLLDSPVPYIEGFTDLKRVANDSLSASFMGIYGSCPEPGTQMDLALQDGHRVNHVFRLALRCIYGTARSDLRWYEAVGNPNYAERRKIIQSKFVEPAIRKLNRLNPLPKYLLCALLVAYCDHNPDPRKWPLYARTVEEDMEDMTHRQAISAVVEHENMCSFDSPKQYLHWLARLE